VSQRKGERSEMQLGVREKRREELNRKCTVLIDEGPRVEERVIVQTSADQVEIKKRPR